MLALALLTWMNDTFAYADSFDEVAGRYLGLRAGRVVTIAADGPGLLVKPEVARMQQAAEEAAAVAPGWERGGRSGGDIYSNRR